MVCNSYSIAYSILQIIDFIIGLYLGGELPREPAHQGILCPMQCRSHPSIDHDAEISRDFLWPWTATRLPNTCEIFHPPYCETRISTPEDRHSYYSRAFEYDPRERP
jgi:hypothetical protein